MTAECGCEVETTGTIPYMYQIIYCPMHASAPGLLAELEDKKATVDRVRGLLRNEQAERDQLRGKGYALDTLLLWLKKKGLTIVYTDEIAKIIQAAIDEHKALQAEADNAKR